MSTSEKDTIRRIIIIDGNSDIHRDFRVILGDGANSADIDKLGSGVFNERVHKNVVKNRYELDYASQGKEGVEKIRQALLENRPFMLAFIDMRMLPGWDGIETIEHIWEIDPAIQIVMCSAYSNYSWEAIVGRLGKSDNLLILKKPFDVAEVSQLANALTEKWILAKQAALNVSKLEKIVGERTQDLIQTNEEFKQEIAEREHTQEKLGRNRMELYKRTKFLSRVLESLTYPFYVIDANDYKIQMANSAAYPWTLPEGATCYMISHNRDKPCDGADNICPLKVVKKTGEPVTVEHVHYNADGNLRNVEVHTYPLHDAAGDISQIIEYCIDITERKKTEEALRESENKYRTLLENLPQKIFLKDKDSIYVSCNQNYAKDLGIKSEEIVGKADYDFFPEELAEKYRADDKRIMKWGQVEDIEENYIQQGQEIIVHTVKTPVKDKSGKTVGLLGIFWDITYDKKAKQSLKNLKRKLKATI